MTAVPAPRTWVTGEVVTAAEMNTNLSDVLTFLMARPIMQCRQTVLQSIANSTSPGTALTFTTEDVDSSGMHSNVTNTTRATAVYPGWYTFGGGVSFASNATGGRGLYAQVNGAVVNGTSLFTGPVNGSFTSVASRTCLIYLNTGDYFEWFAIQNSGGALNSSVGSTEQPSMVAVWTSN